MGGIFLEKMGGARIKVCLFQPFCESLCRRVFVEMLGNGVINAKGRA